MGHGTGESAAELRRKLLWLISLRAVSVTLLLGTAVLVQAAAPGLLPIDPFLAIIGVTYALTAVYALSLTWVAGRRWLIDVQLGLDAAIVSAIVLISGGITSYFSSLYVLPIIAASVIQSRRGGVMVAALSAVAYSGFVLVQYVEPAAWPAALAVDRALLPPARVALYTVGLNVFGFVVVAVLSGYLAEGLRTADARLERASSEIADLQAFNQHVIDSLTSGLATTDIEGRILSFNSTAEVITGHAHADVAGARIVDILQLPPDFEASLHRSFEPRGSRRLDYGYTRPDGRTIEVGLSAAPLVTSVGQSGFLFTFQDVTDARRLERDARMQLRLAAVGEMAAAIAHEIRNPLASMSGSIQILRTELPLTDDQAQLMDIVLRESERLNDTIRSFLAYARPQRLASTRLDLRNLVQDTALLLRNSSECGVGHRIDVEVPEHAVWFEADEGQMRQILWNLATNGLRAMPAGGRLLLAIAPYADGRRDVALLVQDAGVGIPAEELDSIFQPFRGAFARGTGLGLAIVRRIVSDYNGEIEVTSRVGEGTAVRVRFPAPALAGAA
jgi:two-component system sensor histidine kinase PilS (NtrC family)